MLYEDKYKERAAAWEKVFQALFEGNPSFIVGHTGEACALDEIRRLYAIEKTHIACKDELEIVKRRLALYVEEYAEEEKRHAETGALLDKERRNHTQTLTILTREREEHAAALKRPGFLPPAPPPSPPSPPYLFSFSHPFVDDAHVAHARNITAALMQYCNDTDNVVSHPVRVADAVRFLLERVNRLETKVWEAASRTAYEARETVWGGTPK